MQKKIIVLAIAAAMSVPTLAMAEASISGWANMSIDMKNDGAATNATSANQLNSNQSRIIVKGSDDLGGGMSAMWQVDARFLMDTGANSSGTRLFDGNNYLGLKSNDMGTVMVGRLDTPYKSSTRKLDVFFDVAGDNRASLGGLMGSHDSRYDNVLAYASPTMGGLSASIATIFGAETLPQPAAPVNKKGSALTMAGMYSAGPIYATVAYETITFGNASTGDLAGTVDNKSTAFKVGGGYTMDALTVNAIIEMPSSKVALTGIETKNTNMYVAGKFGISSTDAVRLAFTNHGASKAGSVTAKDKATQIAIGYSHDMSKATSVYATYVKTSAEGALADPSTISFGMKHAF